MMSPSMKAKVKRYRVLDAQPVPPDPYRATQPFPTLTEFQFGRNCRTLGFTYEQMFDLVSERVKRLGPQDTDEMTRGYFSFEGDDSRVHFVGVKRNTSQFNSMVMRFGNPDFVHVKADKRMYVGGETGPQDRFFFANHSDRMSARFTVDDSQEF
jgi:hypothetical protein